jgi:hypothetical protein
MLVLLDIPRRLSNAHGMRFGKQTSHATMSGVSDLDAQKMALLGEARQRGQKLLDEVRKQREELVAWPSNIPPQQLQQGREAMDQAILAAQRTLEDLDGALRQASLPLN